MLVLIVGRKSFVSYRTVLFFINSLHVHENGCMSVHPQISMKCNFEGVVLKVVMYLCCSDQSLSVVSKVA